ncbi:MAG: SEL1-like repeat protein [Oceanicaulis sp.]
MKSINVLMLAAGGFLVSACETLSMTPSELHAYNCEAMYEGELRGHERRMQRVGGLSIEELERAADRLLPAAERRFDGAIGLSSNDEYYAAFELGHRLETGEGVTADETAALRFYTLAARHTFLVPVSMSGAGRMTQAPCPSPLANAAQDRIAALSITS